MKLRILAFKVLVLVKLFLILGFLTNYGVVNAEKKVSVSEIVFESPIETLEWAGTDHNVVIAKTQKGHVYRSTNRGKNWRDITDVFAKMGSHSSSSSYSNLNGFSIKSITINPVDKNIILIVGSKHSHFISSNAGETFRRISHSGTIHTWIFHPNKSKFALFSSWTEGCNKSFLQTLKKSNSAGNKCIHQLFVTKDLGATYHKVVDYVVQFHWDGNNRLNQNRIFFTHHRKKQGDQPRYGGWMKTIDFSYTDDFGSHIETPVRGGNKFLASNGYIFVARILDYERQTVSLLVSTNDANSFTQVQLPHTLTEKSYTILDTSEKTVILHVNHGEDSLKGTGNIYISNYLGTRFALSLMNNVRTATGECEFDRVMSLEGVYIANVKDDELENDLEHITTTLHEFTDSETDDEDVETLKTEHKTKIGKMEQPIRTVITFDKGGEWNYLKAPTIDSRGNRINCDVNDGCYLHLHGVSNYQSLAPFYSVENAVGIILGTGNVGSYLSFDHDDINTYMSRDGGLTWQEVHKGAFIYELGDFGGLIVMANDLKHTNQVIFSWNEGLSWYDFELGNKPLQVDNILIEPNSSSMEFLLYGSRGKSGVLYHLDFNTLGQVQCVGAATPDKPDSDYETWSPYDGRNSEKCMLGKQVVYTRKKQTAECYNGQDFRRPVEKKLCTCTEEDFTCEFGFSRQIGSFECRPESLDVVFDDVKVGQCTSSGIFYVTAYRKLPGDDCIGGWLPPPVAIPCPSHAPTSSHARIVLVIALFIIIFMLKQGMFGDWTRFGELGYDAYRNVQYKVLGVAKRRSSSLQGILSAISAYIYGDSSKVVFGSSNIPGSPPGMRKNNYTTLNNFNTENMFMEDDEDEDDHSLGNMTRISGNINNIKSNNYNSRIGSGSNLSQRQRSNSNNYISASQENVAVDPIFDDLDVFEEDLDSHAIFNQNNGLSNLNPNNDIISSEAPISFDSFNPTELEINLSSISNTSFPKITPPPTNNNKSNIESGFNQDNSSGIELL
ncbi:sortilin [Cryptosporidium sp. chipmunk genotype I]|uniref:sortilin n=1 Tax=Cryptosporidium sp. chipmunk genotype I TaxID=1280935 RepID=UPI00351A768A|nr:sortilin [Cryptosporidium sp. chipmunk genotype I]